MSIADPPNGQLPQAELATFFSAFMLALPHRPFQLFLVIGKQSMKSRDTSRC